MQPPIPPIPGLPKHAPSVFSLYVAFLGENNKNIEAEIMVSRSIVGPASDGLQEVIDCEAMDNLIQGIVVGDPSVSPKINLIPFMDNPPSSFRTDVDALDNVFLGPRNTLQTVGDGPARLVEHFGFLSGKLCFHSINDELEISLGGRVVENGKAKVRDVDLSIHLTRRENFIAEGDKVRAGNIPELLEEKRVDTIGTRSFSGLEAEDCFPYFDERRDIVQHSVRGVWNRTHRGRIGWGSAGGARVIRGVQRTIEREDRVLNIPLSVQPVALIVFERKDFVFSPPIEGREDVPKDLSIPKNAYALKGNNRASEVITIKKGLVYKGGEVGVGAPHGFHSKRLVLRGGSTPEVDHDRAMVRVGSRKSEMGFLGHDASNLRVLDCTLRLFVIPLSVASIWLSVTDQQDNSSYGMVEFSNFTGLKYMVGISAVSGGYALFTAVSLWVRSLVTKAWFFFVSDQLVAYLIVTSLAAIWEIFYLAYNGDQKVSWSEACSSFGKFCSRLKLVLVLHAITLSCFLALAVISAYRVFSRFQPPSKENIEEEKEICTN
ncbi:hypothetical protein BC332_09610 [Capsicum chinense]|nr:hypothetical protein BC332_09610 [Capsicum chinense]